MASIIINNTSCCNLCGPPQEMELTQIEQLVEQTLSLQQMEDDYGVDMADVFLKSCCNCSRAHICKYRFKRVQLSECSNSSVKVMFELNVHKQQEVLLLSTVL